jgi:hypothetical protein
MPAGDAARPSGEPSVPSGSRTRVSDVKSRGPGPLDDGDGRSRNVAVISRPCHLLSSARGRDPAPLRALDRPDDRHGPARSRAPRHPCARRPLCSRCDPHSCASNSTSWPSHLDVHATNPLSSRSNLPFSASEPLRHACPLDRARRKLAPRVLDRCSTARSVDRTPGEVLPIALAASFLGPHSARVREFGIEPDKKPQMTQTKLLANLKRQETRRRRGIVSKKRRGNS